MDVTEDEKLPKRRGSYGLLPPDMSNRRIAVLGQTGAGKSSLANTIFGEKLFKIGDSLQSETSKCQAKTKSVNERNITLIETPGFFDTNTSEEDLKAEIMRCITKCSPGPHAFLIVLKLEKFTEQDRAVINKIRLYFSDEAFKYATVVFTHGEQLPETWTVETLVSRSRPLRDLVEKCGGRCHIIDNKYWNENPQDEYRSNGFQVKKLLKSIDRMMMANNGSCYTTEMLQEVEEEIQKEMELIMQSSPNMPYEEIIELAKTRIFKRSLIKWAGISSGALFGLLLAVLPPWPLAVVAAVGAAIGGVIRYFKR